MEQKKVEYHARLRHLMDTYVHRVYDCTEHFPKSELFGLTSQFRRSSLSIILNYIEGYARRQKGNMRNFFEISYGSLQESKYLISFSHKRGLLTDNEAKELNALAEEIGRMLWATLVRL